MVFVTRPSNRGWCGSIIPRFMLVLTMVTVALSARGSDTFNWSKKQNRVSADIHSLPLNPLLEQVASATGWQVYLEPEAGPQPAESSSLYALS